MRGLLLFEQIATNLLSQEQIFIFLQLWVSEVQNESDRDKTNVSGRAGSFWQLQGEFVPSLSLFLWVACILWLTTAYFSIDKVPPASFLWLYPAHLEYSGLPFYLKILSLIKTAESLLPERSIHRLGIQCEHICEPLFILWQLSYGLAYHSVISRYRKKTEIIERK